MNLNKELQAKLKKESTALKNLTKIFDSENVNKRAQKKRKDTLFFNREINRLMAEF